MEHYFLTLDSVQRNFLIIFWRNINKRFFNCTTCINMSEKLHFYNYSFNESKYSKKKTLNCSWEYLFGFEQKCSYGNSATFPNHILPPCATIIHFQHRNIL